MLKRAARPVRRPLGSSSIRQRHICTGRHEPNASVMMFIRADAGRCKKMSSQTPQATAVQTEARPVGTLVSVNVGMPRNVTWRGKTAFTGVFKEFVAGARRVGKFHKEGDGQGDLVGHGSEQPDRVRYP